MATWQEQVAFALRVTADGFDGGDSAQRTAVKAGAGPTVLGLTALVQLIAPIERILAGADPEILKDSAKLANIVLDGLALINPKLAPVTANIELAESAVLWIADMVRAGKIGGGLPPNWHPGPGTLDTIGQAGAAWSRNYPDDPRVKNPSGAIGGG